MKSVHGKKIKTRVLRLESLETRDLLAATGVNASGASDPGCWYDLSVFSVEPSAKEQEMLELINRMRANPAQELEKLVPKCNPEAEGGPWLTEGSSTVWNDEFFTAFAPEITQNCQNRYPAVDADTLRTFLSQWNQLSSVAPLAFNSTLSSVASQFTTYLITHPNEYLGNFAHNENLEEELGGQFFSYGENVYACEETVFNGFSAMEFFHAAFAIDWGNSGAEHRANMMNGDFSELGISVRSSINQGTYSVIDFGTSTAGARTDGAYLLGVVYGDTDGDQVYDASEGISNVRLLIRNLDLDSENTVEITNMSAGGYQIFLQNGHYSITALGTGSDFPGAVTIPVSINGSNVKVDFLTSDYSTAAPQVNLGGGVYYDFGVVVTYAEKGAAISPISGMTISDSDSTDLSKAVVSLDNRPNGDAENIAFSATLPDGITVVNNFKDGTLTLQGKAGLSTYIEILKTLSWSFDYNKLSDGQTMSYEDRQINISVFDGVNWSTERVATLKIDPVDPLMSIASTKVYEGDDGTVYMEFEAVLDSAATAPCYCYVSPVAQTGLSDLFTDDYFVEDRVKIQFELGQSRKTFSIAVLSNYKAQKNKTTFQDNTTYRLEDDLYFTLDVTDCNGLAWRGGEVRGTVIDDDTPSLVITDSHWDFVPQLNFETEYGARRFLYAVTAAESGLMTWSADSDVPTGFTISVYDSVYSQTPLAGSAVTLETTATGQKVQWAVAAGKKYIVKLEKIADSGATYIANQRYASLQVTADNMIIVDPLLIGTGEQKVQLQWKDNEIEFDVNGRLWTLKTDKPVTVSSGKSDVLLKILLDGSEGAFVTDENGVRFSPAGTSEYGWFDGFEEILVVGTNSFETLYFEGTAGDDQLFFESDSDSGYFITNAGSDHEVRYRFTNVTNIAFTGGSDGNDTAELHDSRYNDFAQTSETTVALYGGGYRITATDFQDVQLLFDRGGSDTLTLVNEKDDVEAILFPDSLNVTGTTTRSKIANSAEVSFTLDIQYFNHFIGTPKSSLETLFVLGGNNKSTKYETGIGWFSSTDELSGNTAIAQNFQNIVFGNLGSSAAPVVSVHVDQDAELKVNPTTKAVTLEKTVSTPAGSSVWKLWLPTNYILYTPLSSVAASAAQVDDDTTTEENIAPATELLLAVMIEEDVIDAIPSQNDSCYDNAVSALFCQASDDSTSSNDWSLDVLLGIDWSTAKNRRVLGL